MRYTEDIHPKKDPLNYICYLLFTGLLRPRINTSNALTLHISTRISTKESYERKKLLTWLKYLLHVVILAGVVIAAVPTSNGAEVLAALQPSYAPFILLLSGTVLGAQGLAFLELKADTQLAKNTLFRGYVAGQADASWLAARAPHKQAYL